MNFEVLAMIATAITDRQIPPAHATRDRLLGKKTEGSMVNNVRDFGAVGNGFTNDQAAIQAAINDAVTNNRGGILFPSGTYNVSRAPAPENAIWSLDLNGVQDFMVMGEGPKSVVRLIDTSPPPPPNQRDLHVFILRNNCRRVVFQDLVIDGNRTGLTNPNEQFHGIEVEDGTEDLVIDRCILRECFGDGVRLLGRDQEAEGENVRRVRIENCLFQKNRRSGLSFQRALEQIIIANCVFDATVNDQSIDFEPTGSDAPTDLVIQGCIINHTNQAAAVTLTGISGPDPLLRCKFANNIVLGGQLFCTDVDQLTIQNNTVLVPDRGTNRIPVQIERGGDSVIITGNLLVNHDPTTQAVISLSEANRRQVTRALVANNLCFASSGIGIRCLSSDDVAIQGNMVVAIGSCTLGILVRSESSNVDNVSVRDNDVMVEGTGTWNTGIQIAASPQQIHHVSVIGNSVCGANEGIRFQEQGFQQTPVCALNRIDAGVASPLVGIQNLPEDSVVVGGATSRGGATGRSGAGRFIAGLGDPNTRVTGNVGDIFQRIDGGVGSTLYVKETDDNSTTGWTAK